MGVAILSGVIASLDSKPKLNAPKWELHTPGTLTPAIPLEDDSQPSRFIACIGRGDSIDQLKDVFLRLGGLGPTVECSCGENVTAVQKADVVLLWSVSRYCCFPRTCIDRHRLIVPICTAANPSLRFPS